VKNDLLTGNTLMEDYHRVLSYKYELDLTAMPLELREAIISVRDGKVTLEQGQCLVESLRSAARDLVAERCHVLALQAEKAAAEFNKRAWVCSVDADSQSQARLKAKCRRLEARLRDIKKIDTQLVRA
jgi:hypothetical protein